MQQRVVQNAPSRFTLQVMGHRHNRHARTTRSLGRCAPWSILAQNRLPRQLVPEAPGQVPCLVRRDTAGAATTRLLGALRPPLPER